MATRSSGRARGGGISTAEYGLPVSRTWRGANYAYPRGAGADRGKRPSYPIRPKSRARAARTYAARRNTAGTLSHVDNAIRHVYGSVGAIYSGGRSRAGRTLRAVRGRAPRAPGVLAGGELMWRWSRCRPTSSGPRPATTRSRC